MVKLNSGVEENYLHIGVWDQNLGRPRAWVQGRMALKPVTRSMLDKRVSSFALSHLFFYSLVVKLLDLWPFIVSCAPQVALHSFPVLTLCECYQSQFSFEGGTTCMYSG